MKCFGGRVVDIYCYDSPFNGDVWAMVPSVSKVNMDFGSLMVSAARVYACSFVRAYNSSIKVGSCISSLLVSVWHPVRSFPDLSSSRYSVFKSCCSLVSSIMHTGSSSLRLVLSAPFVFSLEWAACVLCLIIAWWTTSKSNSISRNG